MFEIQLSMGGFVIYFGNDARPRSEVVKLRAERLSHRGPDGAGVYQTSRFALAHRRLSIVGGAGGGQPLFSEDGRATLIANGEIYNHRALRNELGTRHHFRTDSDSEVILHGWEDKGAECLPDLDGMFAFVITDGDSLFAARDRFGIKPLYFGREGDGGFCFASELKALPPYLGDIRTLPAGSLVREDGIVERWFVPPWPEPPGRCADPSRVRENLALAVIKRIPSSVPVGVSLSGGLNSSMIAALMRAQLPELHSFAVGLEGSPDLDAARRVAAHLGTRHHEYIYTIAEATRNLDAVIAHVESYNPTVVRDAMPCYFLAKLAAQHVKVVLAGDGADETLAGYPHFTRLEDPIELHRECVRLLESLHNRSLQRLDRMTMAHGLEARVPFLDRDFVEFAMSIDPREKTTADSRPGKWVLRRAALDLLPRDIALRAKESFSEGTRTEGLLRDHAEEVVRDSDLANASSRFMTDTPLTKEAYLYRRLFADRFPGEAMRETVQSSRRI